MLQRVALAVTMTLLVLPAVAVGQAGGAGMPGGAAPGSGAGMPGGGPGGPGGQGQGGGAPPDPGPPVREEIQQDQRAGADPHRSNPASLPSESNDPGDMPGPARAGEVPGQQGGNPGRGRGPASDGGGAAGRPGGSGPAPQPGQPGQPGQPDGGVTQP